jgi:signal transduction histidine kinase
MTKTECCQAMEPFVQINSELSRHHQGTGLGLPLVKKLIDLHGGNLNLESEPGVGTTVQIDLPPNCAIKL